MWRQMSATECQRFLLDHFRAHAIKGDLKESRTYEVIEQDADHLKIRTRNKSGRYIQTLFADLVTCKSLKYGEFRRVDLFWGVERKDHEADRLVTIDTSDEAEAVTTLPQTEYFHNGDPVPVDAFMSRRFNRYPSRRPRKEKSA